MADIADRFDLLELGDTPAAEPAPEPEPTVEAESTAEVEPLTLDTAELPTFGDWREDAEVQGEEQPAKTLSGYLWKEHVARGYRDQGNDGLLDVGQQLAVNRTRSASTSHSAALSLPSFDLFGGLFDGFAGLGLMLDGVIGAFSLSWLFGPSQAPAVQLILYAVPVELGVMVHGALVNRGVRATAVEFVTNNDEVLNEFFFNVPETQTWLAEHIMKTMKVMWRKVDE